MTEITPGKCALFDLLWVVRFELAYYLEPRDVLSLACTCKELRSYICNEPAIRKRALECARRALQCTTCGTETNNKVVNELDIRLCSLCERTELIPAPIQPPEFLSTTIWKNGPHRYVKYISRRDPVGAKYISRLEPVASIVDPAAPLAQVTTVPGYISYGAAAWSPTWLSKAIQPMWPQTQITTSRQVQMNGVTYYAANYLPATNHSQEQVPHATRSRRTSPSRQTRSQTRARAAPYKMRSAHH